MIEKTYIYIISDGKNCKVGYSRHPEKRLKQLQTGSHEKLQLIHKVAVPKEKASKIEIDCHNKIAFDYKKRGEWFFEPLLFDIMCIVDSVCDRYTILDSESIQES